MKLKRKPFEFENCKCIRIMDGLLWIRKKGSTVSFHCLHMDESDAIAQANDFVYVERLIEAYNEGDFLYLDDNLKIVHVIFKEMKTDPRSK